MKGNHLVSLCVQSTRRSGRFRRLAEICWAYGLLSPDPAVLEGTPRPPSGKKQNQWTLRSKSATISTQLKNDTKPILKTATQNKKEVPL